MSVRCWCCLVACVIVSLALGVPSLRGTSGRVLSFDEMTGVTGRVCDPPTGAATPEWCYPDPQLDCKLPTISCEDNPTNEWCGSDGWKLIIGSAPVICLICPDPTGIECHSEDTTTDCAKYFKCICDINWFATDYCAVDEQSNPAKVYYRAMQTCGD